MKKKVTIPYEGPLDGFRNGEFIYGPINMPTLLSVDIIHSLLVRGIPVVEHISGKQVHLTTENFDKNNSIKKEEVVFKPTVKKISKIEAISVEEPEAVLTEDKVEESQPIKHEKQNNKKNKKHHPMFKNMRED